MGLHPICLRHCDRPAPQLVLRAARGGQGDAAIRPPGGGRRLHPAAQAQGRLPAEQPIRDARPGRRRGAPLRVVQRALPQLRRGERGVRARRPRHRLHAVSHRRRLQRQQRVAGPQELRAVQPASRERAAPEPLPARDRHPRPDAAAVPRRRAQRGRVRVR